MGVPSYLVYDGSCPRCLKLAGIIEKHSKNRVAILPLQSAEATALLAKLLPEGSPRSFFLIEGESVKKGYAAVPAIFSKLTFVGGAKLASTYLYYSLLRLRKPSSLACCSGREHTEPLAAGGPGFSRRQAVRVLASVPLFAALTRFTSPLGSLVSAPDVAASEIRTLEGAEAAQAVQRAVAAGGYGDLKRVLESRGFQERVADSSATLAKVPKTSDSPAKEIVLVLVPFVGGPSVPKAYLFYIYDGHVERIGAVTSDGAGGRGDVLQIMWEGGQIHERRLQEGIGAQARAVGFAPLPQYRGQARPLSQGPPGVQTPAEECKTGLVHCMIACTICCVATWWCCWCIAACYAGYRWCCDNCKCC